MGDDDDDVVGTKVGKLFVILKFLDKGSFGKLYLAKNIQTNEEVAVKLEMQDIERPQLVLEYAFLRTLKADGRQRHKGIPILHYFGPCGQWSALVMELLGPSLKSVHMKCGSLFSLKTLILLTAQLIELFEYFHGKGIVHRDIKPDNFLFGLPETPKYSIVHIIDFGLCKQYRDDETHKHIEFVTNKMMVGTVRYMSINSHNRVELSRRDDMEALGYMLVFFFKNQLPWQSVKAKDVNEKYKIIGQIKMKTTPETLCSDMPQEYTDYIKDVRGLAFDEEPKYKEYVKWFTKLFKNKGLKNDSIYDFDKKHNPISLRKK